MSLLSAISEYLTGGLARGYFRALIIRLDESCEVPLRSRFLLYYRRLAMLEYVTAGGFTEVGAAFVLSLEVFSLSPTLYAERDWLLAPALEGSRR